MTLDEFIREAREVKLTTGVKKENNLSSYRYKKDEYLYEDRCVYVGSSFSGQTITFKNDIPVQSVVYYGKELEPLGDEGNEFLKRCIKIGLEIGCFRGPYHLSVNYHDYHFTKYPKMCEEIITYKNKMIYMCDYFNIIE